MSAAPTTTEIARQHQPQTIKDMLQSDHFKSAVAAALPRHLTADRFLRVAVTATMRQPDLLRCDRNSFFKCLLDLSALGIEPDGRRAHLIPFRNNKMCECGHEIEKHRGQECPCGCKQRRPRSEVQLIVDYKGIAELVRRSGDVSYIHADVVYEHDEWDYSFGSDAHLHHKPNFDDRGTKIRCFYSYVKLKDGTDDFIVMSKSDVDKIRARSKAKDSGPWVSDYDEMGKKTVFRRHSKWLPLSPETRDAIEKDDDAVDIGTSSAELAGNLANAQRIIDETQPPDNDPEWAEAGSSSAAEAVAEQKIEEINRRQAQGNGAQAQEIPVFNTDEWPDNAPTDRPFIWKGVTYRYNDGEGNFHKVEPPAPQPAAAAAQQAATQQQQQPPKPRPVFGRK